jgi:ABC-type nitrate/sulfonate/bicarbonate transport system substrate-binding protein
MIMLRQHLQRLRRAFVVSFCVLGLMIVAPAAHADDTISLATIRGIPTIAWPLYIADAKGMFAAEGIKLEINGVVFASNIIQDVTAGSMDMGTAGLVEPVRAVAKGAHVAIIREEGGLPPFILMAKPAIKTIADLKGKTVSLGGVADSTRVYMERMLASAHLTLDQIDKIYAGSAADRFAQLKSGAVDAALLLPPFDALSEAAGYNNLGDTKDYVKDLPFSGYMVNTAWADAHRDTVKKFLAAYQKAVDWFYDTKNKDEAVAIAVGLTKGDPKVLGGTYDSLRKLQFFAKTDVVPKQHLENLIAIVQELGQLDHPIQPEQLVLAGVTHYVDK